jgi:lysozyme
MPSDLKKDLMRDEGVRYDAYRDKMGNWTIGIGHLLGAGTIPRMSSITDEEMTALYNFDVQTAENRARMYVNNWVLLDSVRQDALINMAFNLGNKLGAFSKFLAAVNRAHNLSFGGEDVAWADAGREMADSLWFKQVGDRAVRLRHMIETGERFS